MAVGVLCVEVWIDVVTGKVAVVITSEDYGTKTSVFDTSVWNRGVEISYRDCIDYTSDPWATHGPGQHRRHLSGYAVAADVA